MGGKLIALVDASLYARSVCENAAWIAGRTGAAVEILHVLGRRGAVGAADLSGSVGLGARSALLAELSELDAARAKLEQQRGRAILEDAEAIVRDAGVTEVTVRLRNGDLLEAVEAFGAGADLVIAGKRGEAADFAKLHLGSNLERVARTSPCPVFVAARSFRPVERVLIAFDGRTASLAAVDHVARDPLFAGTAVDLLTVGGDEAAARKALDLAKAVLESGGHAVRADLLPGGAESVIAAEIEARGVDLLVMGASGRSRLTHLFIGSTTAEMIRSCKVPVLVWR